MCKWGNEVEIQLSHPDHWGRRTVFVDRCIAPIIQALNDANIQTTASCCGHGYVNGTIALENGRWLEIYPDDATFRRESPAMHSKVDIHGIKREE